MPFILIGIMVPLTCQISNEQIYAQPVVNITKVIEEKFTRVNAIDPRVPVQRFQDVDVHYESPFTILMSGKLILDDLGIVNPYLFEALDILRNQFGFKLEQVITRGEGNVANPTDIYILMTK